MDTESMMQKLRDLEKAMGKPNPEEPEMDDDQAEEFEEKETVDSACKLPGMIHTNLIPWYTSGFQ